MAWIEQYLKFDSKLECMAYIEKQRQRKQKIVIVEQYQGEDGVVTLHIRKSYNNNEFPEV